MAARQWEWVPLVISVVALSLLAEAPTTTTAWTANDELLRSRPFKEKSFSVRSLVTAVVNNRPVRVSRVEELYSAEQGRARVGYQSFEARKLVGQGAFFVDLARNHTVLTTGGNEDANQPANCGESNLDQLRKLIYLGIAPHGDNDDGGDNKEQAATDNQRPLVATWASLIAGPASLIFYVQNHGDSWTKTNSTQNVRNDPCDMYGFRQAQWDFSIYYRKTYNPDQPRLPARIQVQVGRPIYGILMFDYYNLELDLSSTSTMTPPALTSKGLEARLDPLALPLAWGCSSALAASGKAKTIFTVDSRRQEAAAATETGRQFSLKAKVEVPTTMRIYSEATANDYSGDVPISALEPYELFVAYDSLLDSMRLDEMTPVSQAGLSLAPTGTVLAQRHLFSFKLNRVYAVREKLGRGRDEDDSQDQGDNDDTSSQSCVVTKPTPWDSVNPRPPYSLGKLLAGADRFVYMGRAQVRGLGARVYESAEPIGQGLRPFWLEPLVAYETLDGAEWVRNPESGATKRSKQQDDEQFAVSSDSIDTVLSTVLYFADGGSGGGSGGIEDGPLLQVDVHRRISVPRPSGEPSLVLLARQTIHVHEFLWRLSPAPNGDQPGELFALDDLCSSGLGNEHTEIEMLMESESNDMFREDAAAGGELTESKFHPLHVASLRNEALLAGLQADLQLPATMVYDLESRLLRHSSGKKAVAAGQLLTTQMMLVSFRLAKHHERLMDIDFLGWGRVNDLYRGPRFSGPAHSFQACCSMVAHREGHLSFAYDKLRNYCYIDLTPVALSHVAAESPKYFLLHEDTTNKMWTHLEVYHTFHSFDMARDWNRGNSLGIRILKSMNMEVRLRWSSANSAGDDHYSQPPPPIDFIVRRFHADERNLMRSTAAATAGKKTGAASESEEKPTQRLFIERIPGFGLLETSAGNRRIEAASLNALNWKPVNSDDDLESAATTMSYEQCHAACLSDFECRSFSVCIRNFEAQCVVSKWSFSSATVTDQLQQNADSSSSIKQSAGATTTAAATASPTRPGTKVVSIEIGGDDDDNQQKQSVELVKYSNCQLYNKNFLELFEKPESKYVVFSKRRNYAVGGPLECAEMCFKRNLEALHRDVSQAASLFYALRNRTPPGAAAHDNESSTTLDEVMRLHRETSKELCNSFSYRARWPLDARNISEVEQHVRNGVIELDQATVNQVAIVGYCLLGTEQSRSEQEELERANKWETVKGQPSEQIVAQRYRFKDELFFEKQYGVRLKGERMTDDELLVALNVKGRGSGRTPSGGGSPLAILEAFVERGGNAVDLASADTPAKCARNCLMDVGPLWPACRSFEFIVDVSRGGRDAYCQLNSMSLRQAIASKRFDLIEAVDKTEMHVWHYEPRPGFVFEETLFKGELAVASAERELYDDEQLVATNSVRVRAFGLLCVAVLAIASGLFVGFHIGQRALKRLPVEWAGRRQSIDKRVLVTRPNVRKVVEFSNQVNEEGLIP